MEGLELKGVWVGLVSFWGCKAQRLEIRITVSFYSSRPDMIYLLHQARFELILDRHHDLTSRSTMKAIAASSLAS